ncbi:hypothetical protein V2J09_005004, partial [Rumex salicifolius]
ESTNRNNRQTERESSEKVRRRSGLIVQDQHWRRLWESVDAANRLGGPPHTSQESTSSPKPITGGSACWKSGMSKIRCQHQEISAKDIGRISKGEKNGGMTGMITYTKSLSSQEESFRGDSGIETTRIGDRRLPAEEGEQELMSP